MSEYFFKGPIIPSKSIFNRALILKYYFPSLVIYGKSHAADVLHLQNSLNLLKDGRTVFDCGDGGTTFRFLALAVSREPGWYEIKMSERLKSRPHEGLYEIFNQLGVSYHWKENSFHIESQGWKLSEVYLSSTSTSQFASSLALNSWGLKEDFYFKLSPEIADYDYFQMTISMCRNLGLQILHRGSSFFIPANQVPAETKIFVEADVSSCFPIAVLGALKKSVQITNFPETSLQPDYFFLEIFKQANVNFIVGNDGLTVTPTNKLQAFSTDIDQCPDLFPVLSVFAAFCAGTSIIKGIKRLEYKESNRLKNTIHLLESCGIVIHHGENEVRIEGVETISILNGKLKATFQHLSSFIFNPDEDHRMAMAALILRSLGFPLRVSSLSVLQKSFPDFVEILQQGEMI